MATRQAKRVQQKPKKGIPKAPIIIVVVLAVLCAAYCALCVLAGQETTIHEGTTVNGIDIGGMTEQDAVSALESGLSGVTNVSGTEYATIQVDPQIEGVEPYTVDLSSSLGYDAQAIVTQAIDDEHGGSFLTRGVRYLSYLRGGKSYTVVPSVTDQDALHEALVASGLLDLNTVVQTTYTVSDSTIDFTIGTSGSAVDEAGLIEEIVKNTAEGNYTEISCPLVATTPDAVDVQAVHDEIYAEPTNATLDVASDNTYTIVDAVDGIDFDVTEAQQLLSEAAEGSVVSVPLTRQAASIDTATLKSVLFRDELGEYTTTVGGSADRRSNVKLAGQKCNGTILLPGETFGYNEVVGQRTAEAGFKAAAAYLNGETVQELGGGVCQVSSTLYCAVMYSNLEIVERHNHTYASSYVPLGMDATVSWGGPDFVFRNNTDYPIKVVCSYANDKITFQIYGTKVSDFKVEITSKTLETISPSTQTVEDNTMAAGTSTVQQSAHTGYKVQTYRTVYDGAGNVISTTDEAYSNYRKTDKIIRVGTYTAPSTTTTESTATTDTTTE